MIDGLIFVVRHDWEMQRSAEKLSIGQTHLGKNKRLRKGT